MNYDYQAKGRTDFAAGKKDERLYANSETHGAEYRRGWQQARRDAEAAIDGNPAAAPVSLPVSAPPPSDVPDWLSDPAPSAKDGGDQAAPRQIAQVIEFPKPAPQQKTGNKPPYRVPSMEDIARTPKNGFRAVSTFSGCGGSSLGYKIAGFDLLWASEFIPAAQETYRANHPSTILDCRDIREVKAEDILKATGLSSGEIDLFDGSPPCASFSTAGIREEGWGRVKKYSDSKQRTDDLFFEYARLIEGTQPKVFVAENVAGLTVGVAKDKMLGSGQLDAFETQEDTILHRLMDCGYRVGFHVLDGADLGVPQARRRVIFVGIRKDLAAKLNLEPVWPRALPWRYTIREALEAPIPQPDVPGVDITRYAIGAEWENLKPGDQSEKYFSLVKVHPDDVCPTICASHGSGSIASITHWAEKRKFSIGELRRLGGFPDDFKLTGSYEQQWERIGRAVPPIMMAAIAATIRDQILEKIRAATPVPVAPAAPVIRLDDIEKLDESTLGENPPKPEASPKPQPVAEGQLDLFG